MAIDPNAVGFEAGPVPYAWTSKDALLYAVGLGAGRDDLAFTTENTTDVAQKVLPTFAVIAGAGARVLKAAGPIDMTKLVHGSQSIELYGEIPVEGAVVSTTRISAIYDKGRSAVIETTSTSTDAATGAPRFSTRSSVVIRGAGGFGGERGPSGGSDAPPQRAPDAEWSMTTSPDQALLYRLSGDRNPLHSDPAFAARAGFGQPILHGLCTYGITGRALLGSFCASQPARFRSMAGRFSSPVLPGETLRVKMWLLADGQVAFQTLVDDDGRVAIDHGQMTFTS
jgi:acyl dehydratase